MVRLQNAPKLGSSCSGAVHHLCFVYTYRYVISAVPTTRFKLTSSTAAVKHENFKTCAQSGFCTRNRALADKAAELSSTWESPYRLDPTSITFDNGKLSGTVFKKINAAGEEVKLPLTVTFLESGTARVTLDEEKRQKGDIELRNESKARKERYNEAESWAIVGGLEPSTGAAVIADADEGTTKVVYGPGGKFEAVIRHSPVAIDFRRDGQTQVRLNCEGLLNMEHWRPKVDKPEGEEKPEDTPVVPYEDETLLWEESFGGNTDSKPRGPESVGLDITFPGYEHVYGIPEHASSLSLKQTRYVTSFCKNSQLTKTAEARATTMSRTVCTTPMYSST